MPSRFISLAILIYWSIAAFCLLTWDVIPELSLGYAPDLRAIAGAGDSTKPVRWSIQIIDDPRFPEVRRTVGEAVTAASRRPDGWVELTSRVDIDAGGLLKGTPFVSRTTCSAGGRKRVSRRSFRQPEIVRSSGQVARVCRTRC